MRSTSTRRQASRAISTAFGAVPGLGAAPRETELLHLDVPFGAEARALRRRAASCAVPGVPAGLGALWESHGRLPWATLVEPALRVAREGVAMPSAHVACLTMLEPVMTLREGARIYAPRGRLLETGERLDQPGLVSALEVLAGEGAASAYTGTLSSSLLALSDERGGLVTAEDLAHVRGSVERPGGFTMARTAVLHPRRALGRTRDARAPFAVAWALGCRPRGRARRGVRRRRRPGDTHDQSRDRRRGGQCLRAHDEPRARLGRLAPRLRPASQQHARRGRPAARPARARRANGEHDGPVARVSTGTASSLRSAPPAARVFARRSSASRLRSSTKASSRKRRSTARACIPRAKA